VEQNARNRVGLKHMHDIIQRDSNLQSAALDEVDGFLKAHGVYEPCTVEEINRQVETLARLGF